MSDQQTNNPEGQAPTQTETQSRPSVPTEISALAQYRQAREQRESSPPAQRGQEGGDVRPDASVDSHSQREQFIPRERFDQENTRRKQLEQELAEVRAQMMQQSFNMPQQQPQYPMAQQQVGRTGMVHPEPQQQQQPRLQVDNPEFVKQWRKKIADNPVTGLAEFTELVMRERGEPLVRQAIQQVVQQLQPLQQHYLNQQIQNYAQQKADDPTFATVRPFFQNLVQTAQSRGVDVTNPQVLSVIEHMARQQAQHQGFQVQPPAPQQPPFSERPGAGGTNFGQPRTPNLTPQQQAMARTFRMSDAEYAEQLRAMGVQ